MTYFNRGMASVGPDSQGVSRGAGPNRYKVEALTPRGDGLRRQLRSQWYNPTRRINQVPLRYIGESGQAWMVVGWDGGRVFSVIDEQRKFKNVTLDKLSRLGASVDLGWDGAVSLGDVLAAPRLPDPVLSESALPEAPKAIPTYTVCKGRVKRIDDETGDVQFEDVWYAYEDAETIPVTMTAVAVVSAESPRAAVERVHSMIESGASLAGQPKKASNYSTRGQSRTVQSMSDLMGL